MLFSSTSFLCFFLPLVLFIYYVFLRKNVWLKNMFLLVVSLFFYAWGEPKFVLVMVLSIVCNYFFGLLVAKDRRKLWIVLMLIFNIGLLFVFKYLMFTIYNINILAGANFTVPSIVLPIGISFFTFHSISYVMDIYRGKVEVQKNLFYVGLYISFFPQLIAGPIVRYNTIADQITNRKENFEDFSYGVCRFILGLAKKVLIANNIALVADKAFNTPSGELSTAMAWLGLVAYTLQIYFDFSGYSDMAIGMGRMFGFHFLENFNYPYIAKSISEFWRRWHISLGSWFRDYVYFPLGGSRVKSNGRLVFNLFVVWGLTGFWHGANWSFICWGLLYFVFITIEKLSNFEKRSTNLSWLKHIYVLFLVMMGWVLFRAADFTTASNYFQTLFHLNNNNLVSDMAILNFRENVFYYIAGIIFSMPVVAWIGEKFKDKTSSLTKTYQIIRPVIYFALFFLALSFIVKDAYNPFIYFNF